MASRPSTPFPGIHPPSSAACGYSTETLRAALEAASRRSSIPVLPQVVDAMLEPELPAAGSSLEQLRADGREAAHGLARLVHGDLAGLFDGPSTVRFDPSARMLSLDLSAISGSDTLLGPS